MKLKNNGNKKIRNFGFGSRDMRYAALNACKQKYLSFSTAHQTSTRFNKFLTWLEPLNEVSDLRDINKNHVKKYATHLEYLEKNEKLSIASCHHYLSAVNSLLKYIRGDNLCCIQLKTDTAIESRCHVATINKAAVVALKIFDQGLLQTLVRLQRVLGLRFEESAKLNARSAFEHAKKNQEIVISDGTKGGLTRTIPILNGDQIKILEDASKLQSTHWSLIPKAMSYMEFQNWAYHQNRFGENFHSNRHYYAQSRYLQLVGIDCPVKTKKSHGKCHFTYLAEQLDITEPEAKILDHDARLIISAELGHKRKNITNTYLG
jgi:hypothetical protein